MERHQITGHTELIGLMAYPIRHSQSPATHNAAYEKLGLDIVNLAFEVDADDLEDAIKGLRALKMRGSNISMPNKTIVHKYLDEVSPAAQLCGAVNTIVNKDGYLIGHNTDGIGYVQSLKDNGIDPTGKKVTIAGSGGAATAVQIQSALDGVAEMSIFARDDRFKDNLNFQKFFHSNVKIGAYLLQHSNLHYFTPVFVSKISIRNGNIASCSLTYD